MNRDKEFRDWIRLILAELDEMMELEEITAYAADGVKARYAEFVRWVSSGDKDKLFMKIPCVECRKFYNGNCTLSKKALIKTMKGRCDVFQPWEYNNIQHSVGMENILPKYDGIMSTFEIDKELKDRLTQLEDSRKG